MVNLEKAAEVDPRRRGSRVRTIRHGRLCRQCGKRKALCTRYTRGRRVNRKRHHDLCFECRRSVRDATRRTSRCG